MAFDRTPDGSYKITNTATDLPLVPGHIRSKLRNFTIGELYDLMSIFKGATSLTESTFHRILEVYALQVMKLQHTHILEADHVRKRDASVVHKLDPGAEISDHVCASCKAPWIHQAMEGKCLGCGQTSSAIPALEATGLQLTVDGVQWTLKAGAKGSVWLPEEGQGISSEQLKALKRNPPSMRGTWSLRSLWRVWSQSPPTPTRSLLVSASLCGRRSPPMSSWMMPNFTALSWVTGHQSAQISKTGNRLSSFAPKLPKPCASKSN